jgi:hypothetical protein
LEGIREVFPGVRSIEATGMEDFHFRLPDAVWLMTWKSQPERNNPDGFSGQRAVIVAGSGFVNIPEFRDNP